MKTSPPPVTATLSAVRSGIPGPLGFALACLLSTLAFANAQETETDTAKTSEPIPFDQIGAVAGRQYSGDAIGITVTQNGARLRAGFQKLEAQATHEGLWLNSTEKEGGCFRLVAESIGRKTSDFQFSIINYQLPPTGSISATENLVTFSRPFLIEEYSVSTDGIRQDFIIAERPAGNGDLRVELALKGASAESSAYGVKLTIDGSMRELAYSRLHVTDATGRELNASLEIISSDMVIVRVEDNDAIYPVRIDPTFSDADWSALGSGMGGAYPYVHALAVIGTDLYAGGNFTTAGGVLVNGIAKWNGSAWTALGTGMTGGNPSTTIRALAVIGTDLYAGGEFQIAGSVLAYHIAKWNGNAWSALGLGMNARVYALAVIGTDLYAGGNFSNARGGVAASYIAKWDGITWTALGSGMNSSVYALAVNGTDLYAGGIFNMADGTSADHIAKWDGGSWTGLGLGINGTVYALAVDGANLYAGGSFDRVGPFISAKRIAKWNGSAWSALGSGMNDSVRALAVSGGDIFAGGYFTTAGEVNANRAAAWNGSAWTALGSGLSNGLLDNAVYALAVDGANNLIVGGDFQTAGATASTFIAKANLAGNPATPEINIEQPLTLNLADGGSRNFGDVALGSNLIFGFTIRNTGNADLTGLAITKNGTDSADFTITASPTAPVAGPSGSTTFTVRFAPTVAGAKTAAIHIASNDADENPYDINLNGTGATAVTVFNDTIAASSGLSGADALPTATPFNDGVENLLKYAFNMNLAGPDSSSLVAGTGTAGLPAFALVGTGAATEIRMEFLRRKGSGLIYTAKRSTNLDSFAPMTGTTTVTPINDQWERVLVQEPCNPATTPRCFGIVEVSLP